MSSPKTEKSVRATEEKVYDRYIGAALNEDNGIRMPRDELDAKTSNMTISEVVGRLEKFDQAQREMYPWADRFVLGFPLPSWQRPLVWSQTQKARLIESIWAGIDIGTYMVNELWEMIPSGKKMVYREFSEVLLDGQQRLEALQSYLLGEFAVADAHGEPRYWQELPRVERRRFLNSHFGRSTVKTWNEKELRRAYDLRAFGGVPHTEDQRASQP